MPTPTFDAIRTTTVADTTTSTISWTDIPQTYTDLVIMINAAKIASPAVDLLARFNNDSGSNYSYNVFGTNGTSTPTASQAASVSALYGGGFYTQQGLTRLDINSYSNTTLYKTMTSRMGTTENFIEIWNATWRNVAAINRIDIISSNGAFTVGSKFTMFGIRAGS